ncbi:hypothetical protein M407DRAFT_210937 [Tulasnella calospora MUT 4182]|uniref:Elongator complex protein 4 n=1 Tax=Tulasnella calospora MUT 4182 TaxID=1051891 RepID=A0A0C3LV07_9AGAM|nr:hypothetical protein M407DRAFT_210937 [Tulasnella calospora MUT 4182]
MSSSFKRKAPATQPPPLGTRLNVASSVLELSTGVPSLDDVLGGGQPLGSILTILTPDRHSNWSELLQRYWIAQGIASGQQVCVVGEPSCSAKLVEGCMWLSPAEYGDSVKGAASEDEREPGADEEVKIAWRYEGMKKFQTTVRTAASRRDDYNHTFELTQKIPSGVTESALQSGQLQYLSARSKATTPPFDEILSQIKALIEAQYATVMRLAIPELGGLYWGDTTPEAILRFVYLLRGMVQSTQFSVLISMPPHLAQDVPAFDSRTVDAGWITKLGFLSDGCLSFSSFGDNPALLSAFPAYHGFVHVHRAPSVRSLVPPSHKLSVLRGLSSPSSHTEGGGENNLGFKCTRKRFVIETLHLDVEGGVSERRTAPPISATVHEHSESSLTSPATKAESAKVAVEAPAPAYDEATSPVTTTKPKKARKVVAFQSGGRDLYDF